MSENNDKNNIREQLYLAALLHDIGKFYQRADEKDAHGKFRYLTPDLLNMQETYCPPDHKIKEKRSHKHVLWTAQFIRENKLEDTFKITGLERLASIHHFPSNDKILELILQKADHWASGVDRTKEEGQKDAEAETEGEKKWDDFKWVQMRSIFEGLFRELYDYKYYLPVSSLVLKKSFFPKEMPGDYNYATLWKDFIKEFKNIQAKEIYAFSETLFNLLHKYTVTVPSSTMHLPDVSLFDHSKMVAAFALCLYDYLNEKNQLKTFDIKSDETVILLIGGDISGIQSYIYNVVSKYAAKNLKGRSFYLQLLVDSVIEKIVRELNLRKANIIYASGGGFYLLAPKTKTVINKLKELEEEISERIFQEHRIVLFLAMDSVALSENDIMGELKSGSTWEREPNCISNKWQELIEKLSEKKRTRYAEKISKEYNYFFEEAEKGGKLKKDYITNEEIEDGEKISIIKDDGDEVVGYIKKTTQQQIDLGTELRQTNYIVKSADRIKQWEVNDFLHYENPCNLDVHWYFLKQFPENKSADNIMVNVLNDLEFIKSDIKGNNVTYDFVFYGGNKYPVDEKNEPKYFDQLTGNKDDAFKRLGVLRMDVDNLGQAFIHGFRDDRKTFSRYTALSRSLDFFFKGYINTIWENKGEYKEWINIVYAGGDDLFVVGKWNVVIDFAEDIYNQFRKWTCYNPYLTLSAGIAIVPPKFPILKAAEMAGDAEHKAKEHWCNDEEKNSVCFLNMPLNWEKEFPVVKDLKKKLIDYMSKEELPSGFLQKINILYEMRKKLKEKKENESWQWIMAYDFARLKQRKKTNSQIKEFIDNLKNDILCNTHNGEKIVSNYKYLELVNLAARWAELELRTLKDKNYESQTTTTF